MERAAGLPSLSVYLVVGLGFVGGDPDRDAEHLEDDTEDAFTAAISALRSCTMVVKFGRLLADALQHDCMTEYMLAGQPGGDWSLVPPTTLTQTCVKTKKDNKEA